MLLYGLQKMTLLDFPGRVACTVFTGGCNFRCPFCHNARLVTKLDASQTITEDELYAFLKKRVGLLDGVCVTGGEPLIHADTPELIRRIRDMGFAVKLDTNGAYPDVLEKLLAEKCVDYVAMDIKNCLPKYAMTVGLASFDTSAITRSIALLASSDVPYEFRTTVTDELHSVEDIALCAGMLPEDAKYFLQCFVDSGELIAEGLHAPSKEKLVGMREAASRFVKNTQIRGV